MPLRTDEIKEVNDMLIVAVEAGSSVLHTELMKKITVIEKRLSALEHTPATKAKSKSD